MSRQPEARTGRDGVPVAGGTPLTRENTRQAVQPLADSIQRLEAKADGLTDRVKSRKAEDERAREDHARELRALEEHLRRPIKAGMLDTPRTRITMSQRLDALCKYQESK